jgi:glycosyltransferase involved in cell wall biosynthesis
MKILWITNIILPEACQILSLPKSVEGGWLEGSAVNLINQADVILHIATVYYGTELKIIQGNKITYYLLPRKNKKINSDSQEYWKLMLSQIEPDLIHIHGTEFPHGLSCIISNPNFKYVVSIQGLVSVYYRYFLAGISYSEIIKNITLRDIIRLDNMFQAKNKFKIRGLFEKEYLKLVKYVIGRTAWDYSHAIAINSNLKYFKCNESLRKGFYESRKWKINNCDKHTIFLSQASYPIKGLHQVLKAVALVKIEFPRIKVKIAGENIFEPQSFIEKFKVSGYAKYIISLIKSLELTNHVEFLGRIVEKQIIDEYLKSNIFICPSSIENSPNSLGEAQLLGVPCIASYVGGVPDMIEHNVDGLLYRFQEPEMLASIIKNIFRDDSLAEKLSFNGIKTAEFRHNTNINTIQTIDIYKAIINS